MNGAVEVLEAGLVAPEDEVGPGFGKGRKPLLDSPNWSAALRSSSVTAGSRSRMICWVTDSVAVRGSTSETAIFCRQPPAIASPGNSQ